MFNFINQISLFLFIWWLANLFSTVWCDNVFIHQLFSFRTRIWNISNTSEICKIMHMLISQKECPKADRLCFASANWIIRSGHLSSKKYTVYPGCGIQFLFYWKLQKIQLLADNAIKWVQVGNGRLTTVPVIEM